MMNDTNLGILTIHPDHQISENNFALQPRDPYDDYSFVSVFNETTKVTNVILSCRKLISARDGPIGFLAGF